MFPAVPAPIAVPATSSAESYLGSFRPYTRGVPAENRWLRQFRGQIYVLEGNIGSGKTTLGTLLVQYLQRKNHAAVFLEERFPHDLLKKYIEFGAAHPQQRNEYALPFQLAVLENRKQAYLQAMALADKGTTVLIDRSLAGDYVFASLNYEMGNIAPEDWIEYLARVQACDLVEPTAIVYIDTGVDDCRRRIGRRARDSEDQYSAEYLHKVETTYRKVFSTLEYPMVTLPWSRDRHMDNPVERDHISKSVFKALEQLLLTDRDGHHVHVVV